MDSALGLLLNKEYFEAWVARMPVALMDLESDLVLRCGMVDFEADFTPGSLRVLERALLQYIPSYSVVWDERNQWLVEGSSIYIGETLINNWGGEWYYEDDARDMYFGLPVVNCPGGSLNTECPPYLVSTTVHRRTGRFLEDVLQGIGSF